MRAPDVPLGLKSLDGAERARAVPLLEACFTGIYRWHAKRTLRAIDRVRGAERSGELIGLSMLERLVPEVGYVYYLAVAPEHRREGVGARLLDDALAWFDVEGAEVAYGAVGEDNGPSLRLFRSRGFREVERKELGYREGGLGAWGLRSRMRLVGGELLLGRRLRPAGPASAPGAAAPGGGLTPR